MAMPKQDLAWRITALIAIALLVGCAPFRRHRERVEAAYAAGDFRGAALRLEQGRDKGRYKGSNEQLYLLDHGTLELYQNRLDESFADLEQAEQQINLRRRRNAGDVVAQWILSDRFSGYIAEPYEDMYVNVFKLLGHLEAGRIQGYATVEARRLGTKADALRQQYLEYREALASEAARRDGAPTSGLFDTPPALTAEAEDGRFIESPLGTFLASLTFLESGDREFSRVAARRLVESIEAQGVTIGPVDPGPFEGMERLDPDDNDLLVVALSGQGPVKRAERFGPFVFYTVPIYFELPVLETPPSIVAYAEVEVEGARDERKVLALVEDLSRVAQENHKRQAPVIYARTLIRASLKAAGTAVAAEAVRQSDDSGLATFATVLGGLLLITLTERADTRGWLTLPQKAHVGVLDLPPGVSRARVVYRSRAGAVVYASPWTEVEGGRQGLQTIVEHYPG